ncbi:hypothetical protein, partial [Acinetobacter ursingii]|uniref:hypothetical protein n=1 Tax=Acinetobacter ursingii TaxID=108980 RepID=UPI00125075EA
MMHHIGSTAPRSCFDNLSKEDLILCLHIRNKFILNNRIRVHIHDLDNELIQMDIDILKSINKLEEIKPIIEDYFKIAHDREIDVFIERVNNLKMDIPINGSTLSDT